MGGADDGVRRLSSQQKLQGHIRIVHSRIRDVRVDVPGQARHGGAARGCSAGTSTAERGSSCGDSCREAEAGEEEEKETEEEEEREGEGRQQLEKKQTNTEEAGVPPVPRGQQGLYLWQTEAVGGRAGEPVCAVYHGGLRARVAHRLNGYLSNSCCWVVGVPSVSCLRENDIVPRLHINYCGTYTAAPVFQHCDRIRGHASLSTCCRLPTRPEVQNDLSKFCFDPFLPLLQHFGIDAVDFLVGKWTFCVSCRTHFSLCSFFVLFCRFSVLSRPPACRTYKIQKNW